MKEDILLHLKALATGTAILGVFAALLWFFPLYLILLLTGMLVLIFAWLLGAVVLMTIDESKRRQ